MSGAAPAQAHLGMSMSRTPDHSPPFSRKGRTENTGDAPQISMRRGAFIGMAGAIVVLSVCSASSLGYIFWRDEALHALSNRHASIERSYEEHIASLRRELDKVNSQRVLQESALETRVRELWRRQTQIEQRANILSSITGGPGSADQTTKAARVAPAPRAQPANGIASPALGFAPSARTPAAPALEALDKLSPKAEKRDAPAAPKAQERPALRGAMAPAGPETAPLGNLASIVSALDRLEAQQVGLATAVGQRAKREARRLESVANQIGLSPDRIAKAASRTGEGGPFVPLALDPEGSPFDRELLRHQDDVVRADRLRRILATAPLARPVGPNAEQTSGFGSRIDPFLGRPAHHTGVDFRETPGASVYATGPGKVVAAGWNGGYGLMVEIDHGNGISTRYAHLSSVRVQEGESISAQHVIGRVGSTGRSTGPHLHYEVRVDDDPVDPTRFLRAGAQLAAIKESDAH